MVLSEPHEHQNQRKRDNHTNRSCEWENIATTRMAGKEQGKQMPTLLLLFFIRLHLMPLSGQTQLAAQEQGSLVLNS